MGSFAIREHGFQPHREQAHIAYHVFLQTPVLWISPLHEAVSFGRRLRRTLSAGMPEAQATLVSGAHIKQLEVAAETILLS